jgi:hypothetical protein
LSVSSRVFSGGCGLKTKFQWRLVSILSAITAAAVAKNKLKKVAIGVAVTCNNYVSFSEDVVL